MRNKSIKKVCITAIILLGVVMSMSVASAEDERIAEAIEWSESYMGSTGYNYWCLKFVQDAYQTGANSNIQRYGYAKAAADALHAENNKDLPPRGAFVFYNWYGTIDGVYKNWGHVGLSLGNGQIIHAYGSVKKSQYDSISST